MSVTTGLFDADAFANDLFQMLASSFQLAAVPVFRYRKLRLQTMVNYMTIVQTQVGGKAGAGVIVLEPMARSNALGLSGAVFDWTFPVVSLELPSVNDDPSIGIGLTAYRLAQLVCDVAHIHADDIYGTLEVDRNSIEDEEQFALPGCIGKRTNFHIVSKSVRTPGVQGMAISQSTNQITLSASTPGASIYYTLDGSWPSNSKSVNPNTNLYSAPFTVTTGQVVRATGYKASFNCSKTCMLIAS